MAPIKRKTVFAAEPGQWVRIQELVNEGRYRTASEFLREAIDDKLDELERAALGQQVTRYCDQGYAEADADLIAAQAIDDGD